MKGRFATQLIQLPVDRMSSRTFSLYKAPVALPMLALLGIQPPHRAPAELRLTIATLHAASLTTPRTTKDLSDTPYFLVTILGPKADMATVHLPRDGRLKIRLDEALGARPLASVHLEPGDSVRVLVSVLEGAQLGLEDETRAAVASTKAMNQSADAEAALLPTVLAPITSAGAHWLGSVELLLTNENGTTYWRALECVATCKVLNPPKARALAVEDSAPMNGVVELSGAGGTYHLQLESRRKS